MKKKGIIIAIASVAAALAVAGGVITGVVLKNKSNESYRVIKVQETEGHSYVNRGDITDLETFNGMVLQSGDQVIVDGNSTLVLVLDEDKYCYLEENTELVLYAEGNAENSKTKIELIKGSFSIDVQNKLSAASSFDVTTPNSTMAIRGTFVNVAYQNNIKIEPKHNNIIVLDKGDDKPEQLNFPQKQDPGTTRYSLVRGNIEVRAVDPSGAVTGTYNLNQGEQIIIGDNTGNKVTPLDYSSLSRTTLETILSVLEESDSTNPDIPVIRSLLEDLEVKDEYTVMFIYNNSPFAEQTVKNGAMMTVPTLSPSSDGAWFGDTDKPVDRDLYIYWR